VNWYIENLKGQVEFINEKILETQESDIEKISYLYGQRDMLLIINKDLRELK